MRVKTAAKTRDKITLHSDLPGGVNRISNLRLGHIVLSLGFLGLHFCFGEFAWKWGPFVTSQTAEMLEKGSVSSVQSAEIEEKIKDWKCSLQGIFDGRWWGERPPPGWSRAIDNTLVTGDHNALSYPSVSLIISPGSSLKFFSYLPREERRIQA